METTIKLNILNNDEAVVAQEAIRAVIAGLQDIKAIDGKQLEGRKWVTMKD